MTPDTNEHLIGLALTRKINKNGIYRTVLILMTLHVEYHLSFVSKIWQKKKIRANLIFSKKNVNSLNEPVN